MAGALLLIFRRPDALTASSRSAGVICSTRALPLRTIFEGRAPDSSQRLIVLVVTPAFAAAWPLEIKAPPLPIERMEQAMQWHKYRTQDPGLAWLRELLRQAVRRMDAAGAAAA